MLEILFHPFCSLLFYFSFIHSCSLQRNKRKRNKKEREVSLDHSAKPRRGAAMAMVSAVALTMACVCPAATVVAQSAAASCSGLFAGETSLGKVVLLPHHPLPFSSIGVSCNTLFMAAPLLDCSNSRLGRRETHLQGRFSRRFAKFQQFNQGADTSAVNLSQEEHDEQEEEEEEEAEEDEEVEDERCTWSLNPFISTLYTHVSVAFASQQQKWLYYAILLEHTSTSFKCFLLAFSVATLYEIEMHARS